MFTEDSKTGESGESGMASVATNRKNSVGVKQWRRAWRLVTVEPVVFCFMYASFLQFTAFMSLTYQKSCLTLHNTTFCSAMDNVTFQKEHKEEQDGIQSEASYWLMVTNVAMAVPSILSVFLFMGPWGDKVDRKIPLIFPCAGAFAYNLCNLLNAQFKSWPIPALIPGLFVNGLAGGYITMLMASYSYVTHVSAKQDRTVRVGIVGSMTYFAGTISVFFSGLLVDAVGHVVVFGICCGLTGIALLYSILFLKSVLPDGSHRKVPGEKWYDTFIFSTARETWAFMMKPRKGNQKLLMVLEIITINIVYMCTTGESNILFLYLKRSPRSFSRAEYGYYKGSQNFSRCLALLTLLPLLKQYLHVRDTTVTLIGLFFRAMTSVMLGLADSLLTVFISCIPALLQGFPSAGLRASMVGRVEVNEHGRLFAVVAATESCVSLATGFIFNGWYPSTLEYFDGTCFMFAAGSMVIAIFVMIFVYIKSKSTVDAVSPSPQNDSPNEVAEEVALGVNQQRENTSGVVKDVDVPLKNDFSPQINEKDILSQSEDGVSSDADIKDVSEKEKLGILREETHGQNYTLTEVVRL